MTRLKSSMTHSRVATRRLRNAGINVLGYSKVTEVTNILQDTFNSTQAVAVRCQFHQHFYGQIFCTNIVSAAFSSYTYVEKAAETTFVQKICTFNVDEIDYMSQLKACNESYF